MEVATIFGTITAVAGSIYNNERRIAEDRKQRELQNKSLDDYTDALNRNSEALKQHKELREEFLNKLENYKKHFQDSLNNSNEKSPEEFDKEFEALMNKYSINSPFESSELMSFSTSIILLCLVTLSALSGLIFNYYIKLYGEEYPEKVPKLILPLMKFYLKLSVYSNRYYVLLILICQFVVLLTASYLKFRGIA